jgi:hypothetical protein
MDGKNNHIVQSSISMIVKTKDICSEYAMFPSLFARNKGLFLSFLFKCLTVFLQVYSCKLRCRCFHEVYSIKIMDIAQ